MSDLSTSRYPRSSAQPSEEELMAQVFRDIRGDVISTFYKHHKARSITDLFLATGGSPFGTYLNRMSRHANGIAPYDGSVAIALMYVKNLTLEAHKRVRAYYHEPFDINLTQIFARHQGAVYMFEGLLDRFKMRAEIVVNPLAKAGLDEQRTSFIPR